MKTGSTVGLAVVAVALVGGAMFYGRQEQIEIDQAAAPVKTITSGITSNTVERVEITVPGESPVTLRQKDQTWYTNVNENHKADKGAVTALFQVLEKEISGEVVSSTPESFEDYQVTETSATRVRVFETGKAEPTEDLIVGKDGGAAFTTYVREAGSDDVLNASASLSYTFKRPEGWRDKQILQIPQDAVTKIEADGTSSTWTLAKNEAGTWKVLQPELGDAQPTKVNPILSNLSNLRATDFSESDAASLGLEPPRQKLVVAYDDKETSPPTPKTVTLLLGDKKVENATHYVKTADSNDIYTIGEYLVTTFVPEPASLALIPPATQDTSTTESATESAAEPLLTSEESGAASSPDGATTAPTDQVLISPSATDAGTSAGATEDTSSATPPDAPAQAGESPVAEQSTLPPTDAGTSATM